MGEGKGGILDQLGPADDVGPTSMDDVGSHADISSLYPEGSNASERCVRSVHARVIVVVFDHSSFPCQRRVS